MKLKDIKSLCEAASPEYHLEHHNCSWHITNGKWGVFGAKDQRLIVAEDMDKVDAEFCCASRTLVPALVAEVEALRDALEDVANDRTGRMHIRIANKALTNHRDRFE